MITSPPRELPYTGDTEADALLAREPAALLIGFALDQQVSVQKAFAGPLALQRRIGTLEPSVIAGLDPGDLEEAFRTKPALHRFPGNMARRTQALCATIAGDYEGDASRIWEEATDGADLERRLLALPGIGDYKAKALLAILGRRFGLELEGLEAVMPNYPTLADVDSAEALAEYQEKKRAYKARLKAEGGSFDPNDIGSPGKR